MINFHGEILPKYQNAQGVIWPIYHMETETGLTIHQIDRGIDTGNILYQEIYPIVFGPTLRDTVLNTNRIARQRGPAAVRHVCEHYAELIQKARPQPVSTKTYTTPTYMQFLQMQRNNRLIYQRRHPA